MCSSISDADGREALHTVPLVQHDEAGFRVDAPVIGQQWASARTTPLQANRQQVEQLGQLPARPPASASAETGRADPAGGAGAPAARPQPMQLPSELPSGHRPDPLRQAREAKLPIPLPKKG